MGFFPRERQEEDGLARPREDMLQKENLSLHSHCTHGRLWLNKYQAMVPPKKGRDGFRTWLFYLQFVIRHAKLVQNMGPESFYNFD